MRTARLQKRLVTSVTFTLALLIVGMLGLGTAIWQGTVVAPALDVRFYKIHILAYRTDYPECPPTTLCPPESVASPPAFYVVWRINNLLSDDQPDSRRSIARLVLAVPLKR